MSSTFYESSRGCLPVVELKFKKNSIEGKVLHELSCLSSNLNKIASRGILTSSDQFVFQLSNCSSPWLSSLSPISIMLSEMGISGGSGRGDDSLR